MQRKVDLISGEFFCLRGKITQLADYSRELTSRAEELKKLKDDMLEELANDYKVMRVKMETDFNARLQKLSEEVHKINSNVETYEEMHVEILNQVKANPQHLTIEHAADYHKNLRQMIDQQNYFMNSSLQTIVSDFASEITIRPASAVFVLKSFSLNRANNEIVFSEPLVGDGVTWRLKLYPNGTGAYKGLYLSIFLEMVGGWSSGLYNYKIVLVKPSREQQNIERDYSSEFENGICWGYNRFCKLEDLENQGFLDPVTDQLVVKFQVKPYTHFQKMKDQANYISHLENQIKKEEEKIAASRLERLNKASRSQDLDQLK